MTQGNKKTKQEGTNSIFVMTHEENKCIPQNQTITYARAVVDICPQKADPHHIQNTTGGSLINYSGELSIWRNTPVTM